MRRPLVFFMLVLTVFLLSSPSESAPLTSKAGYHAYAVSTAEHLLSVYQGEIEKQTANLSESMLFGYSPPSYPASVALLFGYMYQSTGDAKWAEAGVKSLLSYEEMKKKFPKEAYADRIEFAKGLPPISNFFSMNYYPKAYKYLQAWDGMKKKHRKIIEQGVADCANFLLNYPEWGPMNRSILRAEVCLYSAQVLPNHPDASKWRQMGEVLSSDSNQRWEEEDAAHYHPVWLYSSYCYFDAAGDDAYFNSAVTHYYLDYFANQITPAGIIPAYGDAVWRLDFRRWFAIFEKGAAVYNSPLYKWAAENYWNGIIAQNKPATNLGVALNCIEAVKWCDESITAEPPVGETRLVMDDVVGKKIVFRNGIDTTSTYMMLTYRDEGEDAFMAREYLRTTITAEEEKVHHGHSDENSIPLLYRKGSVLLADGGYRPTIPSGDYGEFRADYYHNRLVIRKNRRWVRVLEGDDGPAEQPLQEFMRNSGAYRHVKTQLIDFLKLDKVEYSRSRLTDDEMGYQWDRSIVYHKAGDFFVVIDAVKAKRRDYFTFANMWHTRQILDKGDRWYNTRIDSISHYEVPGDQELLIYFPIFEHGRQIGTYDEQRNYQQETAIYETLSAYYYENQYEVFVTVLKPHAPGVSCEDLVKQFEVIETDKFPRAIGLKITDGTREEILAMKLDLEMDYSQQTIMPRYQYDLGKVQYGPLTTDGNFAFLSREGNDLHWACSHMTRVFYNGQPLHESLKLSFGLQPDLKPGFREGYAKWRYWQDEIKLK